MVVLLVKKEPLIMLFAKANGIAELQPALKELRLIRLNINIAKRC